MCNENWTIIMQKISEAYLVIQFIVWHFHQFIKQSGYWYQKIPVTREHAVVILIMWSAYNSSPVKTAGNVKHVNGIFIVFSESRSRSNTHWVTYLSYQAWDDKLVARRKQTTWVVEISLFLCQISWFLLQNKHRLPDEYPEFLPWLL